MKTIKGLIASRQLIASIIAITVLTAAAFADHVSVDYDHKANFHQVKTYSWAKVETGNSIWDSRVKDAVNKQLAAKGWVQVSSGGDVSVVAIGKTYTQQQLDTLYSGFGGRRFGGFGDATTTVESYQVGTLIVSMYDGTPNQLIWRGTSMGDLSGNSDKNAKRLDKDVQDMFKHFPPKATS